MERAPATALAFSGAGIIVAAVLALSGPPAWFVAGTGACMTACGLYIRVLRGCGSAPRSAPTRAPLGPRFSNRLLPTPGPRTRPFAGLLQARERHPVELPPLAAQLWPAGARGITNDDPARRHVEEQQAAAASAFTLQLVGLDEHVQKVELAPDPTDSRSIVHELKHSSGAVERNGGLAGLGALHGDELSLHP